MNEQLPLNFSTETPQNPSSMTLQLKKPLAIFDLETTGINIGSDRIIEIAVIKIMPDGSQHVKRKLLNPNEMVKDAPTFKQAANEIKQFIDGCDLGGYNSNRFDVPILMEEFLRVGIEIDLKENRLIDVQRIFHQMEQRTLSAAYKFYCNKNLDGAHSAEIDASATWEVLQAQVDRYPQLGTSIESILKATGEEEIVDFARRFIMENGKEVFNFGKHKGRPVAEVLRQEPQYYDWMMKGDFPLHTKQKLSEIFSRTLLKKN
jgi:DNA polymerase-3 subunit epsilon